MADIGTRLADELDRSATNFGLLIYMDDIQLMPCEWRDKLARCLTQRVELRDKFRTHYWQSVEEFSRAADRIPVLDNELWEMLLEVAAERSTRN
jgi:hypothetical protein